MPGDYHILARIHDELNLGDRARTLVPRLINYAQLNDWMGRQIVDLGCGTGAGAHWLSLHNYVVVGVDRSPEMLALARQEKSSVTWLQQDIRQLSDVGNMDMALAVDVLNEMRSLREIESVFQSVYAVLKPGRLFAFDFYTIEGLVQRNNPQSHMEVDSDQLVVFAVNQHDYERQMQTRIFHIFHHSDDAWRRHTAQRVLRAYPIQAVTALVQRSNFDVTHILDDNMDTYEPETSTSRVIILAQKR